MTQPLSDDDRTLLARGLRAMFGAEWDALTVADLYRLTDDYDAAHREDRCSFGTYRDRIGEGHLASYAHVLRVQANRQGFALPRAGTDARKQRDNQNPHNA